MAESLCNKFTTTNGRAIIFRDPFGQQSEAYQRYLNQHGFDARILEKIIRGVFTEFTEVLPEQSFIPPNGEKPVEFLTPRLVTLPSGSVIEANLVREFRGAGYLIREVDPTNPINTEVIYVFLDSPSSIHYTFLTDRTIHTDGSTQARTLQVKPGQSIAIDHGLGRRVSYVKPEVGCDYVYFGRPWIGPDMPKNVEIIRS